MLHHPVRTAQVQARPALAGRAPVCKGLYFSWFETAVNVLVNLVPSVVIAAIAATAIRAAMRPYSIAVAPDSSPADMPQRRAARLPSTQTSVAAVWSPALLPPRLRW